MTQTESRGFSSIGSDDDQRFAEHRTIAQVGKGLWRLFELISSVNDGFQFANRGPFERCNHIRAVSSITPDEALLFHKKWPQIHLHIAAGGRAASDHGAAARQARK